MYKSRYGCPSEELTNWKFPYLMRLIHRNIGDQGSYTLLVAATLCLRQTTAYDVLRLWEDLTHRSQSVNVDLLLQIDYILSHSFYYHLYEEEGDYLAELILIGFDHPRSQSPISVRLKTGVYGSSYFTDDTEQLTIRLYDDTQTYRSISFMGPQLFGYDFWRALLLFNRRNTFETSSHY